MDHVFHSADHAIPWTGRDKSHRLLLSHRDYISSVMDQVDQFGSFWDAAREPRSVPLDTLIEVAPQ